MENPGVNPNRGKVAAQIVEVCRNKVDELSSVSFGNILFQVRYGSVYRIQITSESLINDKSPREILEGKTKEELVELLVGKHKKEEPKK